MFDTEYKDMQVSQLVGLGFTTNNAGKSRIRGLELEVEYLPIEHLTLGVNGGLLDAKYLEFPNCDPLGLGQRLLRQSPAVHAPLESRHHGRLSRACAPPARS